MNGTPLGTQFFQTGAGSFNYIWLQDHTGGSVVADAIGVDVDADGAPDIIVDDGDSGFSMDSGGTCFSGIPDVYEFDFCYYGERQDFDNDGIYDNVDDDPLNVSHEFSLEIPSASFSGSIVDPGDQDLTITRAPFTDGVRIAAGCTGVAETALVNNVSRCSLPIGRIIRSHLDACEDFIMSCDSTVLQVLVGPVEFELGNGMILTVPSRAEVKIIEISEGVFTIQNSGKQGTVNVKYGEETQILEPGQLFDLINVNVDVKPGSCPNPLNVKKKGVLPYAILGSEVFDVNKIDPVTLRFEGVAPLRWAVEDVAAPFEIMNGKENCVEDCMATGEDGHDDLTVKLNVREVIQAIGDVDDGECLGVNVTGNLKGEFGGTAIYGEDVVVILKKQSAKKDG